MILAPLLMVFLLLLGLLAFGMLWHRHKKTCGARNTMVAAAVDPVYSGAYITKDLQPGYIQRRVEEMPTN